MSVSVSFEPPPGKRDNASCAHLLQDLDTDSCAYCFAGEADKRSHRCFGFDVADLFGHEWKKRFLVLKAGFLFRYASRSGSKPKGVPVPVIDAYFEANIDGASDEDGTAVFIVKTIRKVYVYRVASQALADEWVDRLNAAKQHAIKVHMGHATDEHGELSAIGLRLYDAKVAAESRTGSELLMQALHQRRSAI